MFASALTYACILTGVLAQGDAGIFNPPSTRSLISIDFFVGWPVNATTPYGQVAVTPNAAGTVTGRFSGYVVENLTASVETFSSAELGPAVYSEYINEFLLNTDDEESIVLKMDGVATYANGGLHGFANVKFQTAIVDLMWLNYGMFVAEWVGNTNSGTGNAKVEVFEVLSTGRVDGEPIAAINGTSN